MPPVCCRGCKSLISPEETPRVLVFRREGLCGYSHQWIDAALIDAADPKAIGFFGTDVCFATWIENEYRPHRQLVHARN